jgi:hypothetical protein
MKKLIFISIILSMAVTTTIAQDKQSANAVTPPETTPITGPGGTNYYPNPPGTLTRSGYTYNYRTYKLPSGLELRQDIELYNAANIYLDVEWDRKEGTKTEAEAMGKVSWSYYLINRSHTLDQLREIVAGCFTAGQKTDLSDSSMIVQALVDPDTGQVVDVYFSFGRISPFIHIPVETYRSIELALKQNFTIRATEAGRKFNYIDFTWEQWF